MGHTLGKIELGNRCVHEQKGRTAVTNKTWMTSKQHEELFESVKNWVRWGSDDEAGALNLITPELRAAAAAV